MDDHDCSYRYQSCIITGKTTSNYSQTIAFFAELSYSQQITTSDRYCDENSECAGYDIYCIDAKDCNIHCTGFASCNAANIYCPHSGFGGSCNIYCQGENACRDVIINADDMAGDFNLICQGTNGTEGSVCRGITVYGSKSPSPQMSGSKFNVVCGKNDRACFGSKIRCSDGVDCQVTCNGTLDSCQSLNITGPINKEFTVKCEGEESCLGIMIDGRSASKLNLLGCTEPDSCDDVMLHCPENSAKAPNVDATKNCYIEGMKYVLLYMNALL